MAKEAKYPTQFPPPPPAKQMEFKISMLISITIGTIVTYVLLKPASIENNEMFENSEIFKVLKDKAIINQEKKTE